MAHHFDDEFEYDYEDELEERPEPTPRQILAASAPPGIANFRRHVPTNETAFDANPAEFRERLDIPGLLPWVVSSMGPKTEGATCPYCQDEIQADQYTHVHQVGCGNVFHSKCFSDAVDRGNTNCPYCTRVLAEVLTPKERHKRFVDVFRNRRAHQGVTPPGWEAQWKLFEKVRELRAEYKEYRKGCDERLEARRANMANKLYLDIQFNWGVRDRERRKHQIWIDKQLLQGKPVDPLELADLKYEHLDEARELEKELTEATEKQFKFYEDDWDAAQREAEDYFRHIVQKAWADLIP